MDIKKNNPTTISFTNINNSNIEVIENVLHHYTIGEKMVLVTKDETISIPLETIKEISFMESKNDNLNVIYCHHLIKQHCYNW